MHTTKTYQPKAKEIKRDWHLIDAKDEVLGRLATKVARLLMGKQKPSFVPHLDMGDWVVVVNAAKVQVTGKKEKQKVYYRHSGYPSGLKQETLEEARKKHPERIIQRAVSGMLPHNRLHKRRMARLKVFAGEKYPYQDKFKK